MAERGRVRTVPTSIRLALVGGLTGAVLLVALIALDSGPWQDRPPSTLELPEMEPPDQELPDPPDIDAPKLPEAATATAGDAAWLKWVLIGIGILVLMTLLYFGIRALQERRSVRTAKDAPERPHHSANVPEPIHESSSHEVFDPRVAADDVISAWQQVEEAAIRSGTPRLPQHTTTEFLTTLAGRVPIHPKAAQTLLAAYQRARFDHAALTPDQVRIAVNCARTVVHDLRQAPGQFPMESAAGDVR